MNGNSSGAMKPINEIVLWQLSASAEMSTSVNWQEWVGLCGVFRLE